MNSYKGNQTVNKAFMVIDAISDGHRQLKDICDELGLPKTTVHRLLHGLTEARYVREVKGIGFVLGTKMIQLGNRAQQDMPIKEIARPILRELCDLTEETVHLGIMDEDQVFYIDKFQGQRPIQLRSQIGDRLPLAATGIGKALMLDMPKTEWQRILKKQVPANQDNMLERLEKYKQFGYCFDLEDNEDLVHCVAVPIRNRYNNIIAALSVTSVKSYLPKERMKRLAPIVKDFSDKITKSLG